MNIRFSMPLKAGLVTIQFFGSFSIPGFAESEEAGPIERLLDAYDQGDQQGADQVTKSPLFRFMENDVSTS